MAELLQNPKLSFNAINYGLINYELNLLYPIIQRTKELNFEFNNIVGGHVDRKVYRTKNVMEMDSLISFSFDEIIKIINSISKLTLELNHDDIKNIERLLSSSSISSIHIKLEETRTLVTRIETKLNDLINNYRNFDWSSSEKISESNNFIVLESNDLNVLRSEAIQILEDEKNKLETTLDIIDKEIKKNKQNKSLQNDFVIKINEEKDLLIKSFDNKISKVSEQHINNFKNFQLDLEKSYDSLKAANQTIENLIQRNSDLRNEITGYKIKIQEISDNRDNEIKEILEEKLIELEDITNKKIEVIDQSYENAKINHEKFKDLVEKAGIYNLIVNYKEKSEEENEQYRKFRKYTNRAIYWAIGTAFVMFIISWGELAFTGKDTNLLFFIYRMSISLMFFVLAFYSSKQASKHYECFQDNNRTYLQLAALEPFMERMSEDEKKEIRKNLVPIYFSQSSEGKYSSKGDEVTLPADLKGLAEKLIDVGKGLLDKSKDEKKP